MTSVHCFAVPHAQSIIFKFLSLFSLHANPMQSPCIDWHGLYTLKH